MPHSHDHQDHGHDHSHEHEHDSHDHHGHGHHGHHHHKAGSTQVLLISTVIIFGFAIVEALGGWWAHSLALWSDAGHMVADGAALILASVAAWLSARPPSAKHTYGLARAEVLGAMISSVILLLVVIAIVVAAVERLHHHTEVAGGVVAIIAAIGFISNIIVAWVLSRGEDNLNIKAAILHVLGDLLGSVAAIIVGIVIYFTHWAPIDPILSFFISALIFVATLRLLMHTFSVLMEGVPAGIDVREVGQAMAKVEYVRSIHDLHVWMLGSEQIMLTAHVQLSGFQYWENCFAQLKELLAKQYHIEHITLQPEVHAVSLYRIDEHLSP
jgi:cobalt-zinc-cadmium efflux system protein